MEQRSSVRCGRSSGGLIDALILEFIPTIGTIITGFVAVVFALTVSWQLALITLAYTIVVDCVKGYVLSPRIMGRAVEIRPVVSLLAMIAGSDEFAKGITRLAQAQAIASQGQQLAQAGAELTEQGVAEIAVSQETRQAAKEMRAEGVAEIATGAEEVGVAETMAAVAEAIK